MKAKKHWGTWIGSGACLAIALLLLGVTYPKQGLVEEYSREIERLTPIVEQILKQGENEPKNSGKADAELLALLPEQDDFLEFHNMAQKCAVDAGVGPIAYYKMHPSDFWPPKSGRESVPQGKLTVPFKYGEKPGEKSNLRRFLLELDFETDFPALLRFVDRLHQLPRFCQVASLEMEASGSRVRVVMFVEAYAITVPR